MPWARLDDMLPLHPKVRSLSDAAFRLYICAICWSNMHMTDGNIPRDQLRFTSDVRSPLARAAELVTAGLWEEAGENWRIHDYLEYQPSADKVRRERAAKADRQDRWRRSRDTSRDASQDASRAHAPSHPIPSPDTSVVTNGSRSNGQPADLILIQAVQKSIREREGPELTTEQARAVAASIIGTETVRNPVSYVTAAIAREPNLRRFLPTRQPPPFAEVNARNSNRSDPSSAWQQAREALHQPTETP